MTKVLKVDVTNKTLYSALKESSNKCKEVMAKIDEFVADSTDVLVGEGYNNIRGRLLQYYNALRNQSDLCNTLAEGIISCDSSMSEFMEDYSELDDELLPELESNLAQIKSHLAWLESYTTQEFFDEKAGEMKTIQKRNGTDSEIASFQGIMLELEKKINKLRALAPTDASIYGRISDLETDIDSHILLLASINLLENSGARIADIANKYKAAVGNIKDLLDHLFYFYNEGDLSHLYNISVDDLMFLVTSFRFSTGDPEVSVCGKTIYFYSQKGYYDEDGNLIPWDSDVNIAKDGCSIASTATILSSLLGRPVTPEEVAQFFDSNYEEDKGGKVATELSSKGDYDYGYCEGSMSGLNDCLANGGAAKIAVAGGAHWVAVVGSVEIDGQTFYVVNDPWNENPSSDCLWTLGDLQGYAYDPDKRCNTGEKGQTSFAVEFYSPPGTTVDVDGNITPLTVSI